MGALLPEAPLFHVPQCDCYSQKCLSFTGLAPRSILPQEQQWKLAVLAASIPCRCGYAAGTSARPDGGISSICSHSPTIMD